MITGRAPGGSSTPPIVTPAARWTRAPTWAQEPTTTLESTIASSPIQAPTLTNDGGIITTPGARCVAGTDAGAARHDPPCAAARARGRLRVRAVERAASVGARHDPGTAAPHPPGDRAAPVSEALENGGLDLGIDPPATRPRRIGTAARRRPASRSSRIEVACSRSRQGAPHGAVTGVGRHGVGRHGVGRRRRGRATDDPPRRDGRSLSRPPPSTSPRLEAGREPLA